MDSSDNITDVLKLPDINVAATLRDIAANCDKTTGKVLRLCEKAAHQGKSEIFVKVSVRDKDYLDARYNAIRWAFNEEIAAQEVAKLQPTPLVEKLQSLGFTLEPCDRREYWTGEFRTIKVSW